MKNKTLLAATVVILGLALGVALWPKRNTLPAPTAVASPPPAVVPASMQVSPETASHKPGTASNPTIPPKKFQDMGVLERNAILDEIAKQDLPSIFQAMCDAQRVEHDSMKQMHLQTVFVGALRTKKPSPEFLEQMRVFIADHSNLKFERDLVIGALQAAATKETVDLLLKIATTSPDEELRHAAGALAGAGDLGGGGERLSPSLDKVWRESSDPKLLVSVAATMAKIGTPSGIELLLSAALTTDDKDKTRQSVAKHALGKIYLPNAVPPLVSRLGRQPPTSETAKLVVPILVRIGDVTAGQAVVGWLQNTRDDVAPLIQGLIVQETRTEPMLAAWDAALKPAVKFRNEQNREAIRAGLAVFRADRSTK